MAALVAASAAVGAWRSSRPTATPLGVVEPTGGRRPSRLAGALAPEITPSEGGVVHFKVLRRLSSEFPPQNYLVRLDPTADRGRVVVTLRQRFPGTVVRPLPHPDIDTIGRVGYLPGLLAG